MLTFKKLFIIFMFFCLNLSFAQLVKIKKILDSNLFELDDGRKIKLAGVDAPNSKNSLPFFQEVANDAISYSIQNLLDRRVSITSASVNNSLFYELVFLQQNYLLEQVNYNKKFLMRGFGKFINNVDEQNKNELIKAQDHAALNKEGLWLYYSPAGTDTLDQDLTVSGNVKLAKLDSSYFQSSHIPRPIYFAIPLELLAGAGLTIITAIGSGLAYAAIVNPKGEFAGLGAGFFGITIGYLLGFPLGVYLVASHDNPNLSFWLTLGCSVGLTLVTGGLSAAIDPVDANHPTRYIAALSPILGALLYAHVFPPEYPAKEVLSRKKIVNFKDYYDASINFKMELLRIYF